MMLRVGPSHTHPIYIAFKTLRELETQGLRELEIKHLAQELVEKIAEHAYPDWEAITGRMIMMHDLEKMDEEEKLKAAFIEGADKRSS